MTDLSDFIVPETFVCEKLPIGNKDCTDTCDYVRKHGLQSLPAGCIRPWWHCHSGSCVERWLKSEAVRCTNVYAAQIERLRDHYGYSLRNAVGPWALFVELHLKNIK
jgi:hypothetical protein